MTRLLGLPLSVYVTPADLHDTQRARCLLAGLKLVVPRLIKIWADAAYRVAMIRLLLARQGGSS